MKRCLALKVALLVGWVWALLAIVVVCYPSDERLIKVQRVTSENECHLPVDIYLGNGTTSTIFIGAHMPCPIKICTTLKVDVPFSVERVDAKTCAISLR